MARPLLRVAVNDEIVHFFREQLARHGNTDGCVDLVTSEHPNLSPKRLQAVSSCFFGAKPDSVTPISNEISKLYLTILTSFPRTRPWIRPSNTYSCLSEPWLQHVSGTTCE